MAHQAAATAGIDAVDQVGSWARFRVDDSRRCLSLLRELRVGDTPVCIGSPGGRAATVALWAVDDVARRLHFSADTQSGNWPALAGQPDLWAAAYLGDAKLQFPVYSLLVEHSSTATTLGGSARIRLEADLPSHVYHLLRRRTRRVRQGRHLGPQLRFRHPLLPERTQMLSAIDISSEGCGLWKPASELPLVPGTELKGVEVELDANTVMFSDLVVQHVTLRSCDPDSGARVGCSWLHMPDAGRLTLLHWLGGGGRPQPLMKLELD
jgi:hypothetical protein